MNDDQVIDFLKSDMVWHKPTQSFSSSDNFFKVLWSNTLRDDLDKEKLKSDFNHMGQFRYNHKDIKAFEILGISVGSKWEKIYDKFNRQIDYHVAKHIMMLAIIEKHIKNSKKICVIGDGKLNFLLGANLLNPNSQLFYINLPEVLINDYLVMKEMKFLDDEKIEVVEDLNKINYSNKTKLYLIPAFHANFCNN